MYECFAASLNLPIGGLEADEQMDIATAAKTGPIFDFAMLRLLRDRYSIDPSAQDERGRGRGGRGHGTGGRDHGKAKDRAGGSSGGGRRGGDTDGKHDGRAHMGSGGEGSSDGEDGGPEALEGSEEGGLGGPDAGGSSGASDADGGTPKRVTTSILERAVDQYHFRRLLRDVWRCPEDALFLSDRVFDYMDEDGSGSIDVSALHCGGVGGGVGAVCSLHGAAATLHHYPLPLLSPRDCR